MRNEVRCIVYSLYNLVLYSALVFSPLPGGYHLQGHRLIFLDVVGQPYCRESSPAEFVLDTVPMVKYFPDAKRTIQAFLVPPTRFCLCL
jgi:hypothetical protein